MSRVNWLNRLLLGGAAVVMLMIAWRNLRDPVGATLPLGIGLQSSGAVTIVRVGFGGFPLGFAAALVACLVSTRRLVMGAWLVLAVVGGATVARVQGLIVDGVTPYNARLLAPELAMVALSILAIALQRRRAGRAAP